jgi:hypothetical protein
MLIIFIFTGLFSWSDDAVTSASTPSSSPVNLKLMVDRLDEMLGSDRVDDQRDESTLRLGVSDSFRRAKEEEHFPKFRIGLNLKLGILDSWKKKALAWIDKRTERFEKKIHRTEQSVEQITNSISHKDPGKNESGWNFSFEKNFELKKKASASFFVRLRRDFEFSKIYNSFAVEPGWDTRTHLQASASLVSSIHINPKSLLQLNQVVQWSKDTEILLTTESLVYSHFFSTFKVFTFALTASMKTIDSYSAAEEYRISPGYRLAVYRDWTYFSINPYLSFIRENNFQGEPGFLVTLDSVF